MSATMDVDLFSEYFNKSPVLYLEGRQHPIQIYYTKQPQSDYLQAALVSVFQIHQVAVSVGPRMETFVHSLCAGFLQGTPNIDDSPYLITWNQLFPIKVKSKEINFRILQSRNL